MAGNQYQMKNEEISNVIDKQNYVKKRVNHFSDKQCPEEDLSN